MANLGELKKKVIVKDLNTCDANYVRMVKEGDKVSDDKAVKMATFKEGVPKQKCEYVLSLSEQEFFKCFPRKDVGFDENGNPFKMKPTEYYRSVLTYLKAMRENNFELEIEYRASESNPQGRLFARTYPVSLQNFHKPLRWFLSEGVYHDYDMKNAHPVIFMWMCEQEGLQTIYQKQYADNREKLLKENNITDKTVILAKLNTDNARASGNWNTTLKGLIREWNINKKKIYEKNKDNYVAGSPNNPISSLINKMMCERESEILAEALPKSEYIVPMFDGFQTNIEMDLDDLPRDVCVWDEKPIESEVEVPDGFEYEDEDEFPTYEEMKAEFEKTHAKIMDMGCYIKHDKNGIIFKTEKDMVVSYQNMWHKNPKKDTPDQFIKNWFVDPKMRTYRNVSCYPNREECPPDIFNTWKGFAFEDKHYDMVDEEAIAMFKKHVLILSGNNTGVQEMLLFFLAHMFQFPDWKSFVPVFVSRPGGGKGTLWKLLMKLIGSSLCFQTASPTERIFTRFNELLASKFLINIDEASKKEMAICEKKFMNMASEPMVTLEAKGGKTFEIQNFIRFIGSTNDLDGGFPTQHGDRRTYIIRSSDELIGNAEYFTKFNAMIDNDHAVWSIYQFLKNLENVPRKFENVERFPKSEFQAILKESTRSIIDLWLEDFTVRHQDEEAKELSNAEVYEDYEHFQADQGFPIKYSHNQFHSKLSLLMLPEIKDKKVKGRPRRSFDVKQLVKKYGVGCMI